MKSIEEQLKAHFGERREAAPTVLPSQEDRRVRIRGDGTIGMSGMSLHELPWFGVVKNLHADRGFGFVSRGRGHDDLFFHVTDSCPRLHDLAGAISDGDLICFAAGSSMRKPDASCAVKWARLADMDWADEAAPENQQQLDILRRRALRRLSPARLWSLLEATWYSQRWKGKAPEDLTDDVLSQICLERMAKCDPVQLRQARVGAVLGDSRYAFAAEIDPASPHCDVQRLLDALTPAQLAMLGTPQKAWLECATDAHKSTLLEWLLRTTNATALIDGWHGWLTGQAQYEAVVVERILASDLPLPDTVLPWACCLAKRGWLTESTADQLAAQAPAHAPGLYAWLSAEAQRDHLARWHLVPELLTTALGADPSIASVIAAETALAIDLETDGERIWEVACARGENAEMLHSPALGTDLAAALRVLATRIGDATLIVGHNILAWDWPILERELKFERPPLIWDTLLVQYLLEPQARSHALGGTHHADGDALAALDLFSRQLQQAPVSFVSQLLLGAFGDVRQLLDGLILALDDDLVLARPLPALWSELDHEAAPVVLLSEHRLREVDWVPGVVVLQADPAERLPQSLWQIDGERLEQELAAAEFDSTAAQVLLAVMWRAQAQGIVLRRNMIPRWLLDSAPALAAAIDRAAMVPVAGAARRASPFPSSATWWAQENPADYRVVMEGDGALIVDRCRMAATEVAQRTAGRRPAELMCVNEMTGSLWLRADRAAGMLDPRGGWSAFRAIAVDAAQVLALSPDRSTTPKPELATRRERMLHPGAMDQATYWLEILRLFRDVGRMAQGAVPILLTASSANGELMDLLATGLAEVAVAEVRPEHRSRREHLLRAARRNLMLMDGIDQWPAWIALAESAGVTLAPVVEALPLEEWYAAAHPEALSGEGAATIDADRAPASPDVTPVVAAVSGAALLAALPDLVPRFLDDWLHASGLATARRPIYIIDSRAGGAAQALRACMVHRVVDGAAWLPAERARLDVVLAALQVQREPAPDDYASMERFLVDHWQPPDGLGHNPVSGFKDSQKAAMQAICARASDVLVSLPTGEGKSVLFQVPALCRGLRNRRLTLVISPLKALMKDQVERLREQGFAESADYLSGDLTPYEIEEVLQGVLDHRIVLLYVAPERLRSSAFESVLSRRIESDGGLEHVVVDETHCINQWGYEFRPDYFHALEYLLRNLRGDQEDAPTPFLMLSATVTASDRKRLAGLLTKYPSKALSNHLWVPDKFENPLRAHIAVSPHHVHGRIYDKREFQQAVEERLPKIIEAIGAARRNKRATGQRSAVIVFVAWRVHAEELAKLLVERIDGGIDYYHAGLDGETRAEIYTRFREGELDVLVATKAFGMGMDIPDIHWMVHLGPPAYLEDYLQEVGRMGRGEAARERAALKSLSALLLFSNADFESNRAMRARSALQLPMIEQTRQEIGRHTQDLAGERIAFVPQHGYERYKSEGEKRANATRLRMSLYWLERAGAVVLHGTVADLLEADLDLPRLRLIAQEESPLGAVARTILLLEQPRGVAAPLGDSVSEKPNAPVGWFSWLLDGLSESIGFLFAASTPDSSTSSSHSDDSTTANHSAAVLNLSQIRVRCEIKTMDEVMACLADLEKRGGVALRWTLAFGVRPMASEPPVRIEALFASVGGAVDNLVDRLSQHARVEFEPYELLDEAWHIEDEDRLSAEERERRRRRYERAWLHGFRSQARASGLRLRQLMRADDKLVWEAMLASTKRDAARQRNAYLLKAAQALLTLFRTNLNTGQDAVPISQLIRAMQALEPTGRFRRRDLKCLLKLLAAMNVVSARPETLPVSHVVVVRDSAASLESQTDLWKELKQVNDLAEVRVQAMEIFANIPFEGRERFIEGYFAQKGAEELKAFLDVQLGEIEEAGAEDLSDFIQIKREQLRATRMVEFFKFYEASEEPNQWQAIRHPFNRHLLVNAGPGSGKTAVLVGRIAHLIREQQIKPAEIVVLAFNRAVVFEIKKRIHELFMSLGYGSYVRGVRVSTFHSLAMRSLAGVGKPVERGRAENILADFAAKLSSDTRFRSQVAGACRCILVDEFQDVTEDVYSIIRNLYLGSSSHAGVMVIGDDDQDILRWWRIEHMEKSEFADVFFARFRNDFLDEESTSLELRVNFRSSKDIVERSQRMIGATLAHNSQSSRLKENKVRARERAGAHGVGEWLDWRGRLWDEALDHIVDVCCELRATLPPGSLAVLCRSNAEVTEAHHRLAKHIPDLIVQGGANLRVADLRHVALWLDFLDRRSADRDSVLSDTLRAEFLEAFEREVDIPETREPTTSPVDLARLWGLCCQEHPFPHLSTLARFIRDLRSDELERLLGAFDSGSNAVVSTIHKVKGLEFDNVVVLPSGTSFSSKHNSHDVVERDSAEEARLVYVAMTRAKSRLLYFVGDRERAWGNWPPIAFDGTRGTSLVLDGSPKEVWLSWAMGPNIFNPAPDECQNYIEKEVLVGDRILVVVAGTKPYQTLMHSSRTGELRRVGILAKDCGAGTDDADLKVSAVIRYRADGRNVSPSAARRGWGYAVLVAGRLR